MDNDIDIRDLKVGQTLWFVQTCETGDRDAAESDITIGFIYPGTIQAIEELSVTRWAGNVTAMELSFTMDDGSTEYMRYGERSYFNPRFYLSRDEALAVVEKWHSGSVRESVEQLEKARKAVELTKAIAARPIIETDYAVGSDPGIYLSTLEEKIAARKAELSKVS